MVIRQLAVWGLCNTWILRQSGNRELSDLHPAFRGETRDSLMHYLPGGMPFTA
jgi:hypothetical protein